MSKSIILSAAEIQSNHNRVKWAEGLILQLPADHDGRNSWLLNYGTGPEAQAKRTAWNAKHGKQNTWDPVTESFSNVQGVGK